MNQTRDRISLWILFVLGLLLLAAASASRAESLNSVASRTDRFTENPSTKISSLDLENIGGDVQVTPGSGFSATAEVTVHAPNDSLAKKHLDLTKVRFENDNGRLTLVTEEPGARVTRHGRHFNIQVNRDDHRYRIEVRYNVTLPSDAELEVRTINGNVAVSGIGAALDLNSVNGRVKVSGARRDVRVHTVNGSIESSSLELPREARIDAATINGNIELRLPAKASFKFSGQTMSGEIVSTYPFPAAEDSSKGAAEIEAAKERLRADKERLRAEIRERKKERQSHDSDLDTDLDTDLSGLNEELEELSREMTNLGHEIAANVLANIHRSYEGTIAGGDSRIHCSTLNGRIAVLAEGANIADAKSLVPSRAFGTKYMKAFRYPTLPTPPTPPTPPTLPTPPTPPRPPRLSRLPRVADEDGSIVRGDISGDFSVTLPIGEVEVGRISGSAKIVTYAGGIRVVEAGKGAELFTSGGDISIDSVRGDLKCKTDGGEVRVGNVTGDARLDTNGGDVQLKSCGGSVIAKTAGGDVNLLKVHGSVQASTGGGSIYCEVVGRETPAGLSMTSGAGDVTLILPSNYKGNLDIRVTGVEPEGEYIVSDFPEITVKKRASGSSLTAEGVLNGGGPRIVVRISSGTVRLRKGPAA